MAGEALDPQGVPPGIPPAGELRELGRVADQVLPRIIARFGASGLGELEIRQRGWRIRLRRTPNGDDETSPSRRSGRQGGGKAGDGQRPAGGSGSASSGKPGSSGGASRTGAASGNSQAAGGSGAGSSSGGAPDRGRVTVTSPAVGYFLPQADRGVGTTVRQGDQLGHVDVLGVRQDVVAGADGVIGRVMAEAGEAVEYGQDLVRIDRLDPVRAEQHAAEVPA